MDGTRAAIVLDGPMNSQSFIGFCQWLLAPTLHPGDLVVMDNLSRHKSVVAVQAIEDVGAQVVYLPPYSPDLNPIENGEAVNSRPETEKYRQGGGCCGKSAAKDNSRRPTRHFPSLRICHHVKKKVALVRYVLSQANLDLQIANLLSRMQRQKK